MTEPETPQVKEKSPRPRGLFPKNIQTWALLGIAAVMILVIAFSGRNPDKAPAPAKATVIDPNEARIQEYRNRIEENTRKLAAEQERLRSAKEAAGTKEPEAARPSGHGQHPVAPVESRVEKNALELDRKKREYQSFFASNIALTYRQPELAGKEAAPVAGGSGQPVAPIPSSPYGFFPAALPVLSGQPQAQTAGQVQPAPPQESPKAETKNGDTAAKGLFRLFEGTVLETVLTNRLEGAFSGPVNCLMTTDVYSSDGQHLLIPRGSRVLGEANKVEAVGQERLAVAFHRLVMPNGFSVRLDRSPGLDQAGETGIRDKVNNHYARIFGMSMAVGALSGLTQYNTSYGITVSSEDAYRQGISRSLGDSATRIMDRLMNILPTFTIREGHRVKIYLLSDLDLPVYSPEKGALK
jgi:type IV secretion system protein VirB10